MLGGSALESAPRRILHASQKLTEACAVRICTKGAAGTIFPGGVEKDRFRYVPGMSNLDRAQHLPPADA